MRYRLKSTGDWRELAKYEAGSGVPSNLGISFLIALKKLASGLEGHLPRTEIYGIHGFSHIFLGIGLASLILFLRPRSTARIVILVVLVAGIAWELHEGYWLTGQPTDSLGDIVLAILCASAFLCLIRRKDKEPRP